MAERSIVQITLWNSPYLGNFMSSELVLAREVRAQLGLGTHCVLGVGADGLPWLADLDAAGVTWSILPERHHKWRDHVNGVIAEHGGALVHTHFTDADLIGAGAASSANLPCIWHMRTGFNGYPLTQRAKDLIKMRLVARKRVARILAVSPWLGELARRRGAPRDRIEVVPNAVDVERFTELPDRAAARERFGLDPDAQVVVLLGWWPEVKGVDVLIDALEPIADRRSDVQALIVGEGDTRAFLAERLPGQPSWLRQSGFVTDPAWLYAAADIFVSASRHEGQSGAVGEALASRLSVVVSEIAGNAVWAAAPNSLSFPSEDSEALSQLLEQLLDTPAAQREAKGEENRDWLRGHLGMDSWSEQVLAAYRPLL